jgi:acyl transferase domain-containing protein/acyl-CoA synthetase (AMP-forming)/AMP-acid ligase II/pimeloyl-ACP methyl ester carboxylesterase/acyl carrier protein
VDVLRECAASRSDQTAFVFLEDGERESGSIDYRELDSRARIIGAHLQQLNLEGQPVLLLHPSSVEYFCALFGCLYAGAIPVPCYPPDALGLERSLGRMLTIARDARAAVALCSEGGRSFLSSLEHGEHGSALRNLSLVATDTLDVGAGASWKPPRIGRDSIALLQYTSGSTGTPKGVAISHSNLLFDAAAVHEIGHPVTGPLVSWLPPYHDMGLIGGILDNVYFGNTAIFMPPQAMIFNPLLWLQAITKYRAIYSSGPNFALDLCARRIDEAARASLDLSSWRIFFNGSEPVRASSLARFTEAFRPCGFRAEVHFPCYGMAEATSFISGGRPDHEPTVRDFDAPALGRGLAQIAGESSTDSRTLVGCGHTRGGAQLRIVNPETTLECEPGQIGEVWYAGGNVAAGYWNQPEETRRTFKATLAGSGEGPFLRTGDLGFLHQGELFVAGRLKDLIIVRGVNHTPQDIEQTVQSVHRALRPGCGVAFSVERDGQEALLVVQEIDARKAPNLDEILDDIAGNVAARHGVAPYDVLLIAPSTIKKTSSGKLQRRDMRDAYLAEQLSVIASRRQRQRSTVECVVASEPSAAVAVRDAQSIATYIEERLAALLGTAPGAIQPSKPLYRYGLDSIRAVELAHDLSRWLDRPIDPAIAFNYPTVRAMASFLAGSHAAQPDNQPRTSTEQVPIAIVGLGCRFPGGVDSPHAFWKLLRGNVDAIAKIPASRFDIDAHYDPDPAAPNKTYARQIGALEDVDYFDAPFFSISAREAQSLDPQQRLLLEVAWHALEDAGIQPEALEGSRTGVFIGISSRDYADLIPSIDAYAGTGTVASTAAGRISFALGLKGPSMAIDTACSSSLVALHLACQSLRRGEIDLALVGGVNLVLSPRSMIALSQLQALSAEGRCKTFDASADGYVRGEGCGIVVLQRLGDAKRDRAAVRAVVAGSAVNQDGATQGLTAPNGQSQIAVIREALASAGLEPSDVGYVEAHGTGTPLGDPIELRALDAAYGGERATPLWIASVKTNIGHLEAAAGIAGLMKAVLCLTHGEIPAHLHFKQPSPHVDWAAMRVRVPVESTRWESGARGRAAGVSSFGWSGTNAHVIVEQAPLISAVADGSVARDAASIPLLLSGKNDSALRAQAKRWASWLAEYSAAPWSEVVRTAALHRTHFDVRAAIRASGRSEAVEALTALSRGDSHGAVMRGENRPRGRMVFVFPGQGSQWSGMGRALLEQSRAFAETIAACDAALRPHTGWSLLEVLRGTAGGETPPLSRVDVVQPALFSMGLGLAATWRSLGLEPAAVMGTSQGEICAAVVAGALSLEEGALIVARRSQLLLKIAGSGGMAVVELPVADVEQRLRDGWPSLCVAGVNTRTSTVISGDARSIELWVSRAAQQGVFCRRVEIDYASHSAHVDPLLGDLATAIAGVSPRAGKCSMVSTVTGEPLSGHELDAAYWCRNLRESMRFDRALSRLREDGYGIFVEISAHPVLAMPLTTACAGTDGVVVSSLRRESGGLDELHLKLAELHTSGHRVDWARLLGEGASSALPLPAYPFQRQRYWPESSSVELVPAKRLAPGRLLGSKISSPLESVIFESRLSHADLDGYETQERRGGAAMALELVWEALQAQGSRFSVKVEELFDLASDAAEDLRLQVIVTPRSKSEAQLGIYRAQSSRLEDPAWRRVLDAQLEHCEAPPSAAGLAPRFDSQPPTSLWRTAAAHVILVGVTSSREGLWAGIAVRQFGRPLQSVGHPAVLPALALLASGRHRIDPPAGVPQISGWTATWHSGLVVDEMVAFLSNITVLTPHPLALRFDVRLTDRANQPIGWIEGVEAHWFERPAQLQVEQAPEAVLQNVLEATTTETIARTARRDDLLGAGLDSLMLVALVAELNRRLGISLSSSELASSIRLGALTRDDLLARIAAARGTARPIAATTTQVRFSDREIRPAAGAQRQIGRYAEIFSRSNPEVVLWQDADGLTLETVSVGAGARLVVLLPPFGCEVSVWAPMMERLAARTRVVAVNPPGYGRSPLSPDTDSVDMLARGVASLLSSMSRGVPVDLVGWSLGGFVAQLIAAEAPASVRTLTLINTTDCLGLGLTSAADQEALLLRMQTDLQRGLANLSAGEAAEIERLVYWGSATRTALQGLQSSSMIHEFDHRGGGAKIRASTLIVAGENDLPVPLFHARRLHETISGSKLVVLPNVGHYIPVLRVNPMFELLVSHLERASARE